jgi:hypothetical protein
VDAGAALTDRGRWTATLPCLPVEPCAGSLAIVRAPDGVHFCPGSPAAVAGRTERCSVWASGAYRYGTAMAAPVVAIWRRLG